MNYDNNYEQEIDLKDLCFYFLYRWRLILVVAVILALAVGGFKVAKEMVSRQDAELVEESRENYEEQVVLYERNLASYERNIASFSKNVEDQETYVQNSILMQIDPYKKPRANADVQIRLAESEWEFIPESMTQDPADSIVRAYGANIVQGTDWEPIEKMTGVDAIYLKELVSAGWDFGSNQVTLEVCYLDEETAVAIRDEILDQMLARKREIARVAGEHTVTIMNESSGVITDLGLADRQKQNSDRIDNYQKLLTEKEKALKDLKEPEVPTTLSRREVAKVGIKYAVLGGVMGGFLIVFLYGVLYLMGPKLRSEEAMKSQYGFRVLGAFSLPERTGFLCGIDRWLERLEGTAERPSEDTVLRRAAVNIWNYAGEAKEILVTGTVALERLQELCDRLAENLDGIRLVPCENLNVNTDTLKRIAECEGVVLIEERGVSLNREIMKEKEVLDSLKRNVIGCIVV